LTFLKTGSKFVTSYKGAFPGHLLTRWAGGFSCEICKCCYVMMMIGEKNFMAILYQFPGPLQC